jgi:hypothetical protein
LGLNEDENYVLEVEPNIIRINATNDLGALHALKPYYNYCKTAVRIFIFQRLLFRISHGLPGLMIDAPDTFSQSMSSKKS